MKIIAQNPSPGGSYPPIQEGRWAAVPAGTAVWPDGLSTDLFYQYNGFVTLDVQDVNGTPSVVSYAPNELAWEEWRASLPPESEGPAPSSEQEQLRADIDYLAVMMGVAL